MWSTDGHYDSERQSARQLHRGISLGIPGGEHGPRQNGQDPLRYTNVDIWAILGNRGKYVYACTRVIEC